MGNGGCVRHCEWRIANGGFENRNLEARILKLQIQTSLYCLTGFAIRSLQFETRSHFRCTNGLRILAPLSLTSGARPDATNGLTTAIPDN